MTLANTDYRRVIWTSPRMQIVLMCLKPGEEIDEEVHENGDQFFRVEEGGIVVYVNKTKELRAGSGGSIVVPAGTMHRVKACVVHGVKLYTIYSPPQHKPGTVDKTKPSH